VLSVTTQNLEDFQGLYTFRSYWSRIPYWWEGKDCDFRYTQTKYWYFSTWQISYISTFKL